MLQIRTSRFGDKCLGYVSRAAALTDEVCASPSFLTLKTNQRAENAIFATAAHKVLEPCCCLFHFSHYFYLFMN